MKRTLGQRAAVAVAATALAASASAMFSGVAFAGAPGQNTGGAGGAGSAQCLNVLSNDLDSINLLGVGNPSTANCNGVGGAGGHAG